LTQSKPVTSPEPNQLTTHDRPDPCRVMHSGLQTVLDFTGHLTIWASLQK